MTRFPIHDLSSAPEASKPLLEQARQAFGMVPNLIGVLAEAPAAAEAYLKLSELAGQTSFTPAERHVVWFTIIHENRCGYCMAAHTGIAQMEKVDDQVVQAARDAAPQSDPHLEALRQFTLQVVRERGFVKPAVVDAFLEQGFSRQQVLEIVMLLAQKTLSNYVNHLAETPVDEPFQAFAWDPAQVGAARS